jgi:hypothetical protein
MQFFPVSASEKVMKTHERSKWVGYFKRLSIVVNLHLLFLAVRLSSYNCKTGGGKQQIHMLFPLTYLHIIIYISAT